MSRGTANNAYNRARQRAREEAKFEQHRPPLPTDGELFDRKHRAKEAAERQETQRASAFAEMIKRSNEEEDRMLAKLRKGQLELSLAWPRFAGRRLICARCGRRFLSSAEIVAGRCGHCGGAYAKHVPLEG